MGSLAKSVDVIPAKNDNVAAFDPTESAPDKNRNVAVFSPSATPEFQQLAEIARVDLDASPEVLAALGAEELARAEFSILRAGAYFLALKESIDHGRFVETLAAIGISADKAQRAMQCAQYIAKLPADQAKRIAALPKTKILPLTRAEPEVVEQLLSDGSLDGDEPLSVRELLERLRDERERAVDAETRLKAEQAKNKALRIQAGTQSPSIDKEFAASRDQSVYLTERMSHELSLLGEIVDGKVVGPEGWRDRHDASDRQAVAMLIYHTLGGLLASAAVIVNQLATEFGPYVTGGVEPQLQYTHDERERLRELRDAALTTSAEDFGVVKVGAREKHGTRGRHGSKKA